MYISNIMIFLSSLTAICIFVVITIMIRRYLDSQDDNDNDIPMELPDGLGAAVFTNDYSMQRIPVANLEKGNFVWVLGPHGVSLMEVLHIEGNEAYLEDEWLQALAWKDENYFSDDLSKELGLSKTAWRLKDIRVDDPYAGDGWYGRGQSSIEFSPEVNQKIFDFVRSETFFGANPSKIDAKMLHSWLFAGYRNLKPE